MSVCGNRTDTPGFFTSCDTTWAGCDPCFNCNTAGVGIWHRTPVMSCNQTPDHAHRSTP